MKNARIHVAFCCLVILCLARAAAEGKITKPRSSEVVIVARMQFTPALDRDFFSHYAGFLAPYPGAFAEKTKKGEATSDTMALYARDPKEAASDIPYLTPTSPFGRPGDISLGKMVIPKDRRIQIDYARVYVFGNEYFYFDLPIGRTIVVPEGVNYVYLGTFTYTFENEYFTIAGVGLTDEFDAAKTHVAETFGEGAQLVRVNLKKPGDR